MHARQINKSVGRFATYARWNPLLGILSEYDVLCTNEEDHEIAEISIAVVCVYTLCDVCYTVFNLASEWKHCLHCLFLLYIPSLSCFLLQPLVVVPCCTASLSYYDEIALLAVLALHAA
jgi:hypothetical protein